MNEIKKNKTVEKPVSSLSLTLVTPNDVESRMIILRNQPVLIDSDVAELYGVKTKEINQAVRNNPQKFPYGYLFEVNKDEKEEVVKNFDHLKKLKFSKVTPTAFTERGLYMLATILKGDRAISTTLAIVDTFVQVRELKRELLQLHKETDKKKQTSMMKHFGDVLSDIVMPDMTVAETESTLELNFVIGKLKHTVKRVKQGDKDKD